MKRLRSQTSRGIGEICMTTTKTEAWTLSDRRANYILQKTIRMQMEAWTLLDKGSRLYALLYKARIRREIILLSIEDDEMYISMVAAMKDSTCSAQPRKKTSSKKSLKVFLVVHPNP
jgi:hypothetical protein